MLGEQVTKGLSALQGEAVDEAVDMAGHFHEVAAPNINPVAVQKEYRVTPNPEVLPVALVGFTDVEEADTIRDVKTTTKAMAAGLEHRDQQLTTYAMLRQAETGVIPAVVGLDVIKRTPTGKMGYEWRPSTRDILDVHEMVDRMVAIVKAIRVGSFPPTDPGNWSCSERWCGYWNICPYVRGGKRRA